MPAPAQGTRAGAAPPAPLVPWLQLPYTSVVDAEAKNIMYGFALFFAGLVRCPAAAHCR